VKSIGNKEWLPKNCQFLSFHFLIQRFTFK